VGEMQTQFWPECLDRREYLQDIDVDERVISKYNQMNTFWNLLPENAIQF
jgi:hypothetical protein